MTDHPHCYPVTAKPTGDLDFDELTSLVTRFSTALLEKLKAAEVKYGHNSGWMRDDWKDDCQRQLLEHIAKGDPRDVAAYCAFMWHHGWSSAVAQASAWQPIDTAPMDHFSILVYGKYGRLAAFRDVSWEWWPFPALERLDYTPTHWMPLPAPPSAVTSTQSATPPQRQPGDEVVNFNGCFVTWPEIERAVQQRKAALALSSTEGRSRG